jgi:hypothetical protein
MRINILNIFTGLAILTFLTFLKVHLNGNEEFSIAEELFRENNYTKATTHYECAIQWHIPKSPIPTLTAYESKNQTDESLKTCRLLRGAFYSIRSFFTPE